MDVDDRDLVGGLQPLGDEGLELPRPFFEAPAAKEETFRVLVLAAGDRLLEGGHAMAGYQQAGLQVKEVLRGWALRVEERIQLQIPLRRAGIRFAFSEEVPIEIDVVLVESPQPGHAVGVDDVDDYNSRVLRQLRLAPRQPLELDSRTGKAFDPMHAR